MLLDESKLEEKDFKYTYTEILNQADTWLEVYNLYEKRKNVIENFLKKVGKDCKVIFTGAGTSEYVGNIALDYLNSNQLPQQIWFQLLTYILKKIKKHFWFLLQEVEIPQNLLQL